MSEAEDFEQNLSHNYGNPPELRITIPELSDLPETIAPWKSVKIPTDVLLVTVKDCEFLSSFAFLRNGFKSYYRGLGIVYFGDMGDVKDKVNVSLLRCSEGAAGPGAALSKVKTAIPILQPKALFCVGFCGGLSYEKVKLGDVVISAKLTTYAHKKVMNDREQPRGIITPVSRDFADLIKHAADGWKAPLSNPEVNRKVEVHRDGEFLSGPELVNCEWRRAELLEKYPKAIAIEMEGEGVFAAAHDLKMEWVVIKGISDYADGSKSKTEAWQPFASVMAASVVANILKVPGILKDWQHYKGVNHKQEGFSKPGIMFVVSAFVVLLLAIVLVYSNPSINPKENKHTDEFHKDEAKGSRTPNEDPVATLLQSITGGSPGQVNFKGRSIGYRALGRIHSLDELWVYDATAWDIESGIKAKVKHYKESEEAIQDAVKEVIKKLKAQGILQDGSKSKTEAWQPFASVMAASVVANILKVPGILKDWQHYKGVNHKQEGFSKPGIMFVVSAFVVLLLAIALFYSNPSINPKENKHTDEFHKDEAKGSRTPNEDPVATLLRSITGGSPGQVNFKGHSIGYRALGRIHSLDELWVYDAIAWDIESGIIAEVKHYKESEEAIQDAVKEVITKLKAQGMLQD